MMPNRFEILLRAGFYAGMASYHLGDNSYALRWHMDAERISDEEFMDGYREIHSRLVEAGKLAPDQDPFEAVFRRC
jgi:hypothetical protein